MKTDRHENGFYFDMDDLYVLIIFEIKVRQIGAKMTSPKSEK